MPSDRYEDDDRPRRRDEDDDDRPRRRYRDADYDRPPPKSGVWVVFLVLGIVFGVLVLVGVGVFLLLMPAVTKVREASARLQASNNLKQLNLGALNYDSANGKMPGPFVDPNTPGTPPPANPADRLSWRVEMLPYIEQENLYRGINRTQAWNSPANMPFTSVPIKTLGDPQDPQDANTRFRCFYDNGAIFDTDPKKRVSLSSPLGIPDGISNTLLFVETTERVPWAQFNEWRFDPNGQLPSLGHPNRDVFVAAMADGSVRAVKKTVSPATLRSAIQRADGIPLGSDW